MTMETKNGHKKPTQVTLYQQPQPSQNQDLSTSEQHHNSTANIELDTSAILRETSALQGKLEEARKLDKAEIQAQLLEMQRFVRQVERYKLAVNQQIQTPANGNGAATTEQHLRTQRYQIATINQAMSRSQDLDSLLKTTVLEVQQVLQVERVLIYRFASPQQGVVLAEAVNREWTPTLGEELPAACFGLDTRNEYFQKPFVEISDTNTPQITPYQSQLLNKFQVRASLCTCIILEGKAWGLLVAQRCSEPQSWQELHINLLSQIATELALQLVSFEFNSRMQRRLTREKAVARVVEKFRRSLDLATIFKTVTQEVRQLLQTDRVVVYRFNDDWSGEFVAESVTNNWYPLLSEQNDNRRWQENISDCSLQSLAQGNSSATVRDTYLQDTQGGRYQRGEKVMVVEDIYNAGFSQCYLEVLEQLQAKAYLIVAVFRRDRLWGLLAAYQNSGTRHWEQADVNLMSQIGEQLGVALQQAEVVEQQKQQSQQLLQSVERERTVAKIIDRIKQSQDLDTIFDITTREMRRLFNADRVGVYRFNEDWSGEFVAESAANGWISLMKEQKTDSRITQDNGMDCSLADAGEQSKKQQRLHQLADADTYLQATQGGTYRRGDKYRCTDDIYEAGFPPCYLEQLELFQARAYVTVPIFQNNKLWGLLATYQNSGPRHWLEEEINLAVQIGSQLGIALQQAEYIRELEVKSEQMAKAMERERAIAKIIDRIKQSQDLNTIFDITTREMRRLFNADRVGVYRFNEDWSGEFVAESAANGWISLIKEQKTDPRITQDNGMDCSLQELTENAERQQRLFKLADSDTYLQSTEGGTYRRGEKYRCTDDIYEAGFPSCYLEQLELFQARAYVTVPIFRGNKLWGLLATYQNSGPRHWLEEEINLAVQIGSQLGIALQQAEYIRELEAKSEQMAKAVERERAIAQIIDRIKQSQEISTIFDITTKEMRNLFNADRVGIYRFNEDWSGEFVAESAANGWISLMKEQQTNSRITQENGMDCSLRELSERTERQERLLKLANADTYLQATQGGTYRRGEKYRCTDDIYEAGFPACYLEQLELFQARAYITIPIFRGYKLWGLLATYQNSGPRHWLEEEINLAVQIGSQLGIALQQAEYLQELREKTEQLEKIAEQEKAAKELFQKRAITLLSAVRPALDGNLMVRAPITQDELGTIADVYNNTLKSLREIVLQVKTAVAQVAESSHSSEHAVNDLSTQAQQQFQELADALQQVEMVTDSTQAVASDAEAIGKAVQKANQTVEMGTAAMNRTVDGILDIRDSVAEAGMKIRQLGEASQKISRVVNTISDFATQTQLLSLNAAIEATRAGEYGKGFAVVADEVRSLARKSAVATTDIENLVTEVRSQISEVIKVTEAAITQVTAGTDLVENTKNNLGAIASATSQIDNLVANIAQSTLKQIEQSQSVTQTMQSVAAIAENTVTNSQELASSFQTALATSQNLKAVVDQFKVD